MSDPAPLAYGRDAAGRFTRSNTAGHGRAHAFAQQAAALRRAFYAEVKPADMRALVRKLVSQALEGNLQAARLVLLWIVGKSADAHHPEPQPMPADREARERLAIRELAREIRACGGLIPAPGDAGEPALEDRA